tara:strand:+ start:10790 stop:11578 length:789 start_codon:yes stop_codon:yes gene_type:complete
MTENNKKMISEKELAKFRLLSEYDFYVGEEDGLELDGPLMTEEPPEDDVDMDVEGGEGLGGEAEGGEDLDLGAEDGAEDGEEELPTDDVPDDAEFSDDIEPEPMDEPLPEPEPMEDEVELDVTELVQGTEAAKQSADLANQKISALLAKFDELTGSLDKMSAINDKIDGLEQEIEKRNPLPEEKLEMRSKDSYPYNLKLTDYWDNKQGHYDAMNGGEDKKEQQEYVLTQDEVDTDYNSIEIKDTFRDSSEYEDEDEEETIKY